MDEDWQIDVGTDFEDKVILLELEDIDGITHQWRLDPKKALFLAQMLVEKSLNIMD